MERARIRRRRGGFACGAKFGPRRVHGVQSNELGDMWRTDCRRETIRLDTGSDPTTLMRPNYPVLLTSCIVMAAAPLHAQSSDGSEMFLNAYSSFQKAESMEKRGDAAGSLSLYKEVAKALGQLGQQFPNWSPEVVKYRAQLTEQAIQRIQNGPNAPGGSGPTGASSGRPAAAKSGAPAPTPSAPQAVPAPGPASVSASKPRSVPGGEVTALIPQIPQRDGVPVAPTDPFADIQNKLNQLQNDLQFALEEAQRLRKEKSALLKNLEETASSASKALDENVKARAKAEDLARILEQRADVAERALLAAREDKTKAASQIVALEKERDGLRQQRRELQAEVDASDEIRRRQDARLAQTQGRETVALGEKEAALQQVAQGKKQLDQAQGDLAKSAKDQAALSQKLEKTTGERDAVKATLASTSKERDEAKAAAEKQQAERDAAERAADKELAKLAKERDTAKAALAKASQERDDALAVSGRLKTARAQLEKLDNENKDAAAKLAKVQQQIEKQRQEGVQSEQVMKAMRDEVEGVRSKLADAQTKAAGAEKSVGELEGKLAAAMQQVSTVKTEASQAVAEREKEHEERELLQGILNRTLQEQSRRDKTRKDLVAEVSRLKVSSDALMKQIGLLGEPVLQLNEKEQALFKQPTVEISEDGISISAMKTGKKGANPVGADTAPQPATEPSKPDTTAKPTAEAKAGAPKAPAGSSSTAASGARAGGTMSNELRQKISEAKEKFDKGDFGVAEKLYQEALDSAPGNAFVLSNLGVTQFRAKRYAESEESLKKALELSPEDAFSRSTLGIVYYTQGKLDKAVDELTQSVAVNPSNAVAHNYLGIAASRKGWQENARKELETAAELDPTYADAYFNLAVVCASQKPADKEAARKAYQKAVSLGAAPDSRLEELIR